MHRTHATDFQDPANGMDSPTLKNQRTKSVKNSQPHVVIVTKCVPPYRYPVFKRMQDLGSYSLKIFSGMPLSESVPEAAENLKIFHPKGINIHRKTNHGSVNVDQKEVFNIPVSLPYHIFRHKPDLVIAGNMGPKALMSMLVAKLKRVPFVIWTEEITETAASVSGIQQRFRNFLLPRTDAFLAWGQPAHDYMVNLGYPKEKVYYCAQAVDNERWVNESKTVDRDKLRTELELKGRIFLMVGQMIERKGFDHFMRAWAKIPKAKQAENQLLFVGDGDYLESLKALAESLEIPNYRFLPQQSQDELPALYSSADVLVFPSLVDVWGMVTNEALACGTPVLASKYAGSSQELIDNDDVGELIDPLDTEALVPIIERWIEKSRPDPEVLRNRVRKVNFDVTVEAFNRLIKDHTALESKV